MVAHARRSRRIAELLLDEGVLEARPLLEFFGWAGAAAVGGAAVLPWRPSLLSARSAAVEAVPEPSQLSEGLFRHAAIHQQKGRAATWWGLAAAWRRLEPGGALLLLGGNDLGIKTAVRRLEAELGQRAEILAKRAHGRVARFRRTDSAGPPEPDAIRLRVSAAGDSFSLRSEAGVFSADEIDPGSQLLLERLADTAGASKIFDPGCGVGVLGMAALRRSPESTAVLADADWRAVRCARANAAELGLAARCRAVWWDAESEPPPADRCDLVLLNPPFHTGAPVNLDPARAMFRAIDAALAPGGTALIVANRTLPWERELRRFGTLERLDDRRGYKVLRLSR